MTARLAVDEVETGFGVTGAKMVKTKTGMIKPLKTSSAMTEAQVQKWRQQGESEKRVMFLFFSVLFSAIVASVLLLTVTALPAAPAPQQGGVYQGRHGRRMQMSPERELARLSKELKLTKDQQAKIKPILDNEYQQMSQVRQDSSMSWQDRRGKFMDIRNKSMAQIRPILTDKQQAKLQQIEQRREERMKAWQASHGAPSAPQSQ
jgi:periplasmic protein CpxP/Spy